MLQCSQCSVLQLSTSGDTFFELRHFDGFFQDGGPTVCSRGPEVSTNQPYPSCLYFIDINGKWCIIESAALTAWFQACCNARNAQFCSSAPLATPFFSYGIFIEVGCAWFFHGALEYVCRCPEGSTNRPYPSCLFLEHAALTAWFQACCNARNAQFCSSATLATPLLSYSILTECAGFFQEGGPRLWSRGPEGSTNQPTLSKLSSFHRYRSNGLFS